MKHPVLKTLYFVLFAIGLLYGALKGNIYIAGTSTIFLILPLLPRKWFY